MADFNISSPQISLDGLSLNTIGSNPEWDKPDIVIAASVLTFSFQSLVVLAAADPYYTGKTISISQPVTDLSLQLSAISPGTRRKSALINGYK